MTTVYDQGRVPEILPKHRLRIARDNAGLEQNELADIIGISRQSVSNAESGKSTPRKVVFNAWALATGVPVQWLLTGEAESPRPDGDPNGGSQLPRLDSNQQPSD
ncbi:helix-turn-helix transcriptional regulator [Rhodococcus sp. 14-2470-1a]|uniref:helix-turn-helix transcriptional regulator n=1 Tax=Rhodococcus sp. 14-2470-1a TaxID=2023150 RepID=UPI000B9B9FC0|nr:helix-turn-helix transcriptional regulator [Rhodococcus sp. 14-2470-1a]OZF47677.1 DNA-binding protein [Rhodococcus sp. 14-2470-1a]